jgi:hypothetical protein
LRELRNFSAIVRTLVSLPAGKTQDNRTRRIFVKSGEWV